MYHGIRNEIPGIRRASRMNTASFLLREARDRIRGGKPEDERQADGRGADDRRVQEILQKILLPEDFLVVLQRRREEELRRPGDDVDLRLEGRRQHPEEREQDDERNRR